MRRGARSGFRAAPLLAADSCAPGLASSFPSLLVFYIQPLAQLQAATMSKATPKAGITLFSRDDGKLKFAHSPSASGDVAIKHKLGQKLTLGLGFTVSRQRGEGAGVAGPGARHGRLWAPAPLWKVVSDPIHRSRALKPAADAPPARRTRPCARSSPSPAWCSPVTSRWGSIVRGISLPQPECGGTAAVAAGARHWGRAAPRTHARALHAAAMRAAAQRQRPMRRRGGTAAAPHASGLSCQQQQRTAAQQAAAVETAGRCTTAGSRRQLASS